MTSPFRMSLVLLSLVLIGGSFLFYHRTNQAPVTTPVSTTTEVFHCDNDAKFCPDGSTVLREGPQCEFAACPSIYGDEEDWRSREDEGNGFTFDYPVTLGTNYVSPQLWPPTFTKVTTTASCEADEEGQANATTSSATTFNGVNYCLRERSEGAAGSRYTTYEVSFPKGNEQLQMHFSLRRVQCANYEGTEQSACTSAQESFKVVELVDAIRATIR